MAFSIFENMKEHIIISERNRPFFNLILAALCFTGVVAILYCFLFTALFKNTSFNVLKAVLIVCGFLIAIGIKLCVQKRVVIDLLNSRFKPITEIGPIKTGRWNIIKNYEYVSVFCPPMQEGDLIFEVNLWYDTNKHFQLYKKDNYKDAFIMAFDISEELNISLLDATIPHEQKWIDKDEWKRKMNDTTP